MTWVRVDDHFADHPKVMALGSQRIAGLGLWTAAACYCARYLTDGFVPYHHMRSLAPIRLVGRMVDVGLFDRVEGGYRLHDWLEYNPPREKVEAERRAAKDRMNRKRSPDVRPNEARTNGAPTPQFDGPVPVPQSVPEVLLNVLGNGSAAELDWIDPGDLYLARTGRQKLSQKERDWLEDLHVRFSRTQLVAALQAVPNPKESNWLKKVDAYLEHAA